MAENEDRLQEGPNRFDRELEARLLRAQQSAGIAETVAAEFELPNGTFGTMTGKTTEEVLGRIDILRRFYCRYKLSEKTEIVTLSNGQQIVGVPVGFTGREIFELADAALAIHDQQNDYPLCQRLQSNAVQ